MSLNTTEVVNKLRSEKARLELSLRKINLALEALLGGKMTNGAVRAKKISLICQNAKCRKSFLASRKDAQYCSRECAYSMDKRRLTKGQVLIAGAQR